MIVLIQGTPPQYQYHDTPLLPGLFVNVTMKILSVLCSLHISQDHTLLYTLPHLTQEHSMFVLYPFLHISGHAYLALSLSWVGDGR